MEIIDLSLPILSDHFRWPMQRGVKGSFSAGDPFQASWFETSCHAFTHVGAPCHMVPGGPTLDDLDLGRVFGRAAVIDLTDLQPNEEVTVERLSNAAAHLRSGEIALMRSCWDEQRDWRTRDYWYDAPYMSRPAAEWLLARGPSSVAFDFPQDYTIRLAMQGDMRPIAEHVTHDVLLRNNVTLVEYLCNVRAVSGPHVQLAALPVNLPASDGAPARVIAWTDKV